jgi:enamine deaminase RidA (YjgF/YER057c/UK114 family)
MSLDPVNPDDLGKPTGFTHGQLGREGGRVLFVAGQTGVDEGEAPARPLVEQFGEALRRVVRVVEAAGGGVSDIGRMTVYVTNMELYRSSRKALGPAWRSRMGAHYPAMALVEVKSLVDHGAVVEIEAVAVIGGK